MKLSVANIKHKMHTHTRASSQTYTQKKNRTQATCLVVMTIAQNIAYAYVDGYTGLFQRSDELFLMNIDLDKKKIPQER